MSTESPQTRQEIVGSFAEQDAASQSYWNAFDTTTFFAKIGSSWSPADTVRHLNKSTRPVAQALATPKILLRFKFGRAKRPSLTYPELRARYDKALSEGGQAGRFGPSDHAEGDLEAWRRTIMAEFVQVNRRLRDAIERWSETSLDRLQLPHPLLGNLTVREMLFFTLYHQRHHIEVVDRRRR